MVVVQVPPTAYALCGNHFRDLRQPPRHRADAVAGKTSRDVRTRVDSIDDHSARRPDLWLARREGLEPVIGQHLRGHVDPLVLLRRGPVRVVPVPRHHGQVAPLLREQRDTELVLVLRLLAGPLGHRPAHDCEHRPTPSVRVKSRDAIDATRCPHRSASSPSSSRPSAGSA